MIAVALSGRALSRRLRARDAAIYQIENTSSVFDVVHRRKRWSYVSGNVLLLGLTSLFTDISSEMVATILPLYLVYSLGLSPLQFGVVDGLQQGGAALVRVGGGFVGDRWRRHKQVACVGYGISAMTRIGLLAAGSAWGWIMAMIVVDRTGKGIRTAPRDALISLSSDPRSLGTAFAIHRALDTAGAMSGPLLAFGLLALAPGAYDTIFVVSFCFAVVGFSILALFVQNQVGQSGEHDPDAAAQRVSLRTAASLLRIRRFRVLIVVAAGFGLVTISDGFLYLGLQRRLDFDVRLLPLLYVGTALAYMLFALPAGYLADRIGRGRVFIGGYLVLALIYAALLAPAFGTVSLFVYLILFGAYYAATEGVLMAIASALLPAELRGTGLALLVTATGLARLIASIVFGAIWTLGGINAAILAFTGGLVLALPLAAIALRHRVPSTALA